MPDAIAQFAKAKYLNLETFRKTGVGVRTPGMVRAGSDPVGHVSLYVQHVFYVYSPDAGKVKRIRNNPRGAGRAL